MELQFAFMGVAIGLGLIVIGAGIGIGRLAAGAAEAIARQPSASAQITGAAYTININTQMNYWPVELTNLSELHEPLFRLLGEVAQTGRIAARDIRSRTPAVWPINEAAGDTPAGWPGWQPLRCIFPSADGASRRRSPRCPPAPPSTRSGKGSRCASWETCVLVWPL